MLQVNPQMLIQMIKGGQNPQQLLMNVLQSSNTPMANNLLSLAQNGNGQQLEQIARNMCESQGKDFDTEFKAFRQMLGL